MPFKAISILSYMMMENHANFTTIAFPASICSHLINERKSAPLY